MSAIKNICFRDVSPLWRMFTIWIIWCRLVTSKSLQSMTSRRLLKYSIQKYKFSSRINLHFEVHFISFSGFTTHAMHRIWCVRSCCRHGKGTTSVFVERWLVDTRGHLRGGWRNFVPSPLTPFLRKVVQGRGEFRGREIFVRTPG